VALSAEGQCIDGAGAFHPGKGLHRIENVPEEQPSLLRLRVALRSREHHRSQNVTRLKTRIGVDQLDEAPQQLAADEDQHHRECDFGRHQCRTEAVASAGRGAARPQPAQRNRFLHRG
jgi:hypothetical protein